MLTTLGIAAEERGDTQDEIARLVRQLHETQERLLKLTGGEVDAVLLPDGQSYLLREAQEKLRKSEAAQRDFATTQSSILNALPAHIALIDRAGVILSVNDGWRRFAGSNGLQNSAAGPGQNYLEICEQTHGDSAGDAQRAAAGIRMVLSGAAREFSLEYPCHAPTGQHWFQLMVSPILEPGPGGAAVMHVDITERKRTEARFRRLVDSNAQGVIFWNTKGEITGANDAFLRLTHYTRQDLQAGLINWVAMTPPAYASRDANALKELTATGVCATYEKKWIRKDGGQVWVLLGAAMFEDNSQEGVCFVLDLTERKKLEQQFLRAQRMESIGTLASGVAHDLNNILAPIMMSVPVLRMEISAETREGVISTIEMSAERGAQIVRQVLTFGRGVTGEKRPLHAGVLIREMVKIMRGTFPKNITVEHTVAPDLWQLTGDATHVHQVLLNLCVNARDAMPDGGRLRLSARNLEVDASYASMVPGATPGMHVLIEVGDTGTGMPPEIIERIFDPFFTTKGVGEGTGLGLSTVHGIVRGHGGFIRVESTPGRGTAFRVHLPAATEADNAPAAASPAVPPRGRGELVLVVDDEEAIAKSAQTVLEMHGYRVVLAGDGTEALAAFAQNHGAVAVVLTDLMMPIMDGMALIRALRKMQPDLSVIASTGLDDSIRAADLKSLHVQTVLKKPYGAEALLRTIHEALHPAADSARSVP